MGFKMAVKKTPPGPVLVEDFTTGIDDWTLSTQYANATVTWYNSDSMRCYVNSSGDRAVAATWNIGIAGDFDIEINYENTLFSGSHSFFAMMKNIPGDPSGNNRVRLESYTAGGLYHAFFVDGVQEDNVYLRPILITGKFRFVRSGNDYTTYYDAGSGWVEGYTSTHSGWGTMYLKTGVYVNTGSNSTVINSVIVNTGTIV